MVSGEASQALLRGGRQWHQSSERPAGAPTGESVHRVRPQRRSPLDLLAQLCRIWGQGGHTLAHARAREGWHANHRVEGTAEER